MTRKLIQVVVLLTMLVAGARVILPASALGTPAEVASTVGTSLIAIGHRIHGAVAHATTTQLLWGAGAAWLAFVLTLVLLARSRPTTAQDQTSRAATSTSAADAAVATPRLAQVYGPAIPEQMDPGQGPNVRCAEPLDHVDVPNDARQGDAAAVSMVAPTASTLVSEQAPDNQQQPSYLPGFGVRQAMRRSRTRTLALAGVSLTREQRWPYGLFVVAEDTGTPQTGRASERTVEVITEQVAPMLAYSPIPGSPQRSALLKMAVMRASIDLRQQCIRTAADLESAVTGSMVVGNIVHIVNVGDCRTYVFRPGAGLLQVATDHLLMSRLVAFGLLEPNGIDLHVPGSQISHRVGGSEAGSEVDTLAIRVHADDVLILCSAGLWQALRMSDIEAILRATTDPQSAATTLAQEAASRAGQDDIRVIVVRPLREEMPEFGIAAAPVGYPRASNTAEQFRR